jgi:hypothetical protein
MSAKIRKQNTKAVKQKIFMTENENKECVIGSERVNQP